MQIGDKVEILFLADRAYGRVSYVEKYSGAVIVKWTNARSQDSFLAVFPGLPYLPQPLFKEEARPDLFAATAWLYWKDHIWPVPVGQPSTKSIGLAQSRIQISSRAINNGPIQHTKDKIDYINRLAKHMTADLVIHPGNDEEQKAHDKWWR